MEHAFIISINQVIIKMNPRSSYFIIPQLVWNILIIQIIGLILKKSMSTKAIPTLLLV